MVCNKEFLATSILKVLSTSDNPVPVKRIRDYLARSGTDISERSIRNYLVLLEKRGFTRSNGHRGRTITPAGRWYVRGNGIAKDGVRFLSARMEQFAYGVSFSPRQKEGMVCVNVSLVPDSVRNEYLHRIHRFVTTTSLCLPDRLGLLSGGTSCGGVTVPDGYTGICTIHSITIKGILLKQGVPVVPCSGGILEIDKHIPRHFHEIINYDITSIDPVELFIISGMTGCTSLPHTHRGRVAAAFWELPAESLESIQSVERLLTDSGIGGLYSVGLPGTPLGHLPVREGQVGAILIDGLNAVAPLLEKHRCIVSHAMAGYMDYAHLCPIATLLKKI